MHSKVTVDANQQGQLISTSPRNSKWGWIRVVQTRIIINDEGIAKSTTVSALVQGFVKDLATMGWEHGMELKGNIIFKDSMQPFNKKAPEKNYKIAGTSGVLCTVNDQPVYRKYFYSVNNIAEDYTIEHTNKEEITQMYTMLKDKAAETEEIPFEL